MSLQTQIQPYLGVGSNTGLPAGVNPDQTFKAYVESLLNAKTKGFSGTFVDNTTQQSQQSKTPTTSITEGLFSKYLNDGGGGDSSTGTGGSGGTGQGISSSAQDLGFAMMGNPQGAAAVVNNALGLMGINNPFAPVMSLAMKGIGTGMIDNQIDAISNSFGAMSGIGNMGLGGVGSISDANGNISSISNQGLVDAYDMGMFGTTGAGLAGSGDGGFGFGGVNASDTGGLGFGGGSLGGFADGGFGGGDSGVGASEGADGSPGGGY